MLSHYWLFNTSDDGGFKYVALLSCMLLMSLIGFGYAYVLMVDSMTHSFGGISTAMATSALTMQFATYGIICFLSVEFIHRLGSHVVGPLGLAIVIAGNIIGSFIYNINLFIIVFNLFAGGGMAFLYMSVMNTVSEWFANKARLSFGFCLVGIGIGGILFSQLLGQQLIIYENKQDAWRYALRNATWPLILLLPISFYALRSKSYMQKVKTDVATAKSHPLGVMETVALMEYPIGSEQAEENYAYNNNNDDDHNDVNSIPWLGLDNLEETIDDDDISFNSTFNSTETDSRIIIVQENDHNDDTILRPKYYRETTFQIYMIHQILYHYIYYLPWYIVVPQLYKLGFSGAEASTVITAMSFSSMLGRVCVSFLFDKLNIACFHSYIIIHIMLAFMLILWYFADYNYYAFLIVALNAGFWTGGGIPYQAEVASFLVAKEDGLSAIGMTWMTGTIPAMTSGYLLGLELENGSHLQRSLSIHIVLILSLALVVVYLRRTVDRAIKIYIPASNVETFYNDEMDNEMNKLIEMGDVHKADHEWIGV